MRATLDDLCVSDGVRQTLVAIAVVVIPVSTPNDRQLRHQATLIGFGCVPVWRYVLLEDATRGWCSNHGRSSQLSSMVSCIFSNTIAGICTLAHTDRNVRERTDVKPCGS